MRLTGAGIRQVGAFVHRVGGCGTEWTGVLDLLLLVVGVSYAAGEAVVTLQADWLFQKRE